MTWQYVNINFAKTNFLVESTIYNFSYSINLHIYFLIMIRPKWTTFCALRLVVISNWTSQKWVMEMACSLLWLLMYTKFSSSLALITNTEKGTTYFITKNNPRASISKLFLQWSSTKPLLSHRLTSFPPIFTSLNHFWSVPISCFFFFHSPKLCIHSFASLAHKMVLFWWV